MVSYGKNIGQTEDKRNLQELDWNPIEVVAISGGATAESDL